MFRIPILIALVAILATLTIGIATGGSSSAHAMAMDSSEPPTVSEESSRVRPVSLCQSEHVPFAPQCSSPIEIFVNILLRLIKYALTQIPPEPAPPPLPGPTPAPADNEGFFGCLPAYPLGPC